MTETSARDGYAPIYERLLPLYLQGTSLTVAPGYRKVAHLAHGWYMRCLRGGQAVITLDHAGYAVEAAGIRRSIIEHVVALKWLAVEGDKIGDTVARAHAHSATRRLAALTTADWRSVSAEQIAEVITSVGADLRNSENDYLSHFMQRATEYADVHTMPGYLAECDQTHACYESAITYIRLPDGSPLPAPSASVPQLSFVTAELLDATLALNPVFVEPPWADALEQVRLEFLAVTDAVRMQDGLPPVDWTTGTIRDDPGTTDASPDRRSEQGLGGGATPLA